ncbi:MAG TPA: geranylgeranylglycerol-phosphate geranylgeranyltransferase [Bacteroidota bacterium]|nr:geranylgeranylglycerol-phosphate geranylgeranyltransferase [Bacteroidota bacterium]
MRSKRFKAYFQLSRPVNVLMAFAAVAVGCWIAGARIGDAIHVFLAAVSVALVVASANAINDFFDLEIDRINKPERPLPKGILAPRDALRMWFLCALAAMILNAWIGRIALAMIIAAVVVLYWYSAYFKRTALLGNILAAGIIAWMIFLYSGVVAGNLERSIVPALFAFLSNFGRELIKDVEDLDGDRAANANTLPVRYGIASARWFFAGAMMMLIITTIAAIVLHLYNLFFTVFVVPVDGCVLVASIAAWRSSSSQAMHRISTLLKICMVMGLLGIMFGSVM